MAQTSLPQGGSGVGDAGPYSSDEWAEYLQIVYTGDQQATQGPLIRYLNELVVTNPAGLTINIDTGAGFVDGHLLINDTDVDIFVTLCGTPGQTRQNRVIMVENNTNVLYSPGNLLFPAAYAAGIPRNSARLAILQGSCGTPGGLPALVQNANYWYTELARFTVSSAAVGALTDYRDYCEFSTNVVAGMIANRTRSFLVPASNGNNVTDDVALRDTSGFGLTMTDNKVCLTTGYFSVPSDYVSGFSVEAIIQPNGSGNVYSSHSALYGACGELYNTHTEAIGSTAVAVTDDLNNCIQALSLPGAAIGDIVCLKYTRTATNVADTINSFVLMKGWFIEYTADS